MQQLLKGVRVLDVARFIAGPFGATVLADMGAEVIRVENPGGGDDRENGPQTPVGDNFRHVMMNRNKKGVTLDLAKPKGAELFRRLVQQSDVVFENFSPPVQEKLGLTYDALRAVKPDIILVSVSAFGTTGPYRDRLGFDPLAQAESGAMNFSGYEDGPPTRNQVSWVDLSTGIHAALGAIMALLHRKNTGEGQAVEAALFDTAVSYVAFQGTAVEYEVLGIERPRIGNAGYFYYADTFEARDGHLLIAVVSTPLWRRLAALIEQPQLANDPRFADDTLRYENRHVITECVQEWVGQRTVAEVTAAMDKARVPIGRVNELKDMLADPHVAARGLLQKMEAPGLGSISYPRIAVQMSRTPPTTRHPAPGVGEHNREVYCGLLGLSDQDLAILATEKIV